MDPGGRWIHLRRFPNPRPCPLRSGLRPVFKKPSDSHHTSFVQIRNNPPVRAELLLIGWNVFASQFSVKMKSQVSHATLLWTKFILIFKGFETAVLEAVAVIVAIWTFPPILPSLSFRVVVLTVKIKSKVSVSYVALLWTGFLLIFYGFEGFE